jgi:DNA-directed RNA polymerase specialized sigma24 family protein
MNPWPQYEKLVSIARKVVRDEDTARDIATEVCAEVVSTHAPDGTLPATVVQLATRVKWRALDHLRKGKLEVVRGYDIERAVDTAPTPEQELEAKQTLRGLRERLGEVEMFVLERTGEGFSSEEIAVKLSKTAVAVDHIRSRARRKLMESENV